jgi:uncharacterized coiled-coil protein SlyX
MAKKGGKANGGGESKFMVLEHRVGTVEKAIEGINRVLDSLNKNLERLVQVEVRHAEARATLDNINVTVTKMAGDLNGIGSRVSVVESRLDNHTWALRLAGAALLGFVIWMIKLSLSGLV